MGTIRHYECKCGYGMDFYEGAGLRACNKSVIQQFFSEELEERKLQEKDFKRIFWDRVLAECPQCRELKTAMRCTYQKQGAEQRESIVKDMCPECRSRMRILENTEEVLCPKCGETMEGQKTGHWD